jgi:predicted nucleic acid-binding protein
VAFVVDASVMASWHFPDERSPAGDDILVRLRDEEIHVPALSWFEMKNVLLTGERRGRSSVEDTAGFLDDLRQMTISVALLPDEDAVMALARCHNLTFYDAAYLELAKRENHVLATFDRELMAAARAEGVALA